MATAQPKQPGISNAGVNYGSSAANRKRLAPPNSDTTRRRRYQSPTSYSSTAESRADYPTTSDKFSAAQYDGGIPTAPVGTADDPTARRNNGVRNPRVNNKKRGEMVASGTTPHTTSAKVIPKTTTRSEYNTGLRPSPQPRARRKKRGLKKLAATGYRLAARVSLLSTYAWTGFLWSFIQLPLAILVTVFVGAVIGVEVLVGNGIAQDLYNSALSLFGVDWDFQLAAFVSYAVLIAVCYLQLAGIWLQCVLTGMHPTSGRGGGLKFSALLLCLVLYWIPFVNMLPVAWLWIFTITLYPR